MRSDLTLREVAVCSAGVQRMSRRPDVTVLTVLKAIGLDPDMPVSELRHRLAVPVDSICHLLGAFIETGVIKDEDIAHLDAIHGWLGGAS